MGPCSYGSLDPSSDYENGPWAQFAFASHCQFPGPQGEEYAPIYPGEWPFQINCLTNCFIRQDTMITVKTGSNLLWKSGPVK